jgi:hypothetical protein
LDLLLAGLLLLPCFTYPSLLFLARLSLACRCGLSFSRLNLSLGKLELSNTYEALMAAHNIRAARRLDLHHRKKKRSKLMRDVGALRKPLR